MTPPDSPSPRTEAGKRLAEAIRREGWIGPLDAGMGIGEAITAIEAEAAQEAPAPEGLRVRDVRLLMIDGIGADLSREFAQGDPFEPFDRTYVVKQITRVLDAARDRTRTAAPPTPAEPPRPPNGWNAHPPTTALPTDDDPEAGMPYRVFGGAEARPPEGLDAAWTAAAPLLPEGWGVQIIPGQPQAWEAGVVRDTPNRRYPKGSGHGPTPAAALLDLAARLSAGGATE